MQENGSLKLPQMSKNTGIEKINISIYIRILTPGANVIKLFTAVSYDFSK
jgi:hypothetical protein